MPQSNQLLLPSVAALFAIAAASCVGSSDVDVEVIKSEMQDVSLPLSDLAPPVAADSAANAAPPTPPPASLAATAAAATVQNAAGAAQMPAPIVNFEGLGKGLPGSDVKSASPDVSGAIGPNHYVQAVNFQLAIFNRSGARLFGPVATNTLWSGFDGACATTNDGSPIVRYDRIADRWVISQASNHGGAGPFFQCVSVSTTPDPTGSYHRYQFQYGALNDSPKLSVWPDAYYFTSNTFAPGTFSFLGGKTCAVERAKLLVGAPVAMQCFDTGPEFGNLLAADFDGTVPPPAGAPNLHVALTPTALATWQFHVDFAAPGNSSFAGPTLVPVDPYTQLCSSGPCVSQPGTAQKLDSLGDRLMDRLAYRNFGNHESLVVSHAVTAGVGGGVRFYELRTPATPSLFQQGTYAPDANFRWMSSAAMDKSGNLALGFSASGDTLSPSIRYAGRHATDPLGKLPLGETTLITGTGAQTGLSRWGDYGSMSVDPTDDCTLWYTQEYLATTGSFNWRTRVGSFRFANCGMPANDFAFTPIPPTVVIAGKTTTIAIAISATNAVAAADLITLSVAGLPAGITGSFSPAAIKAGDSSTLTLTADLAATPGTFQIAITGETPSATRTANIAIAVTNARPTVAIVSPASGSTVSSEVVISATATVAGGTVASVRFDLPDGTSVTDATAPYEARWNSATVANGSYAIRAMATDSRGFTEQSTTTVTVANAASCIADTFTAVGLPIAIPDNNATGITSSLQVVGNGNVASLELSLAITHAFRGDLKATLISPSGARFVVSNRAGGAARNLVISNQVVTAFAGQPAAGTWTLVVQDLASIDVGTLTSWSLRITGNCTPRVGWSGVAAPHLPTIDNGTACTSLNVTGPGDASLAQLDIAGHHSFRSILRATLAHNGVTVAAFPTGTFAAAAGDFSLVNRKIPTLSGSATGTWTLCIVDTDAFGDTGVLDSWSVHD